VGGGYYEGTSSCSKGRRVSAGKGGTDNAARRADKLVKFH
jgi:hypothetical protein